MQCLIITWFMRFSSECTINWVQICQKRKRECKFGCIYFLVWLHISSFLLSASAHRNTVFLKTSIHNLQQQYLHSLARYTTNVILRKTIVAKKFAAFHLLSFLHFMTHKRYSNSIMQNVYFLTHAQKNKLPYRNEVKAPLGYVRKKCVVQ
jgi:hypothetical protein